MKKTLKILLFFVIVMMSVSAYAYTSEYYFDHTGGEISYNGSDPYVDVPPKLYSTEVVGVGVSGFSYNENLRSVTLPEGITSIGSSAFAGCTNLTSINLPDTVRDIGYQAFENCGIKNNSNYWDNGGLYIDNCLIAVDPKFKGKFVIREGTRVIAHSAFDMCFDVTDISIPDSVEYIGADAFSSTNIFWSSPDFQYDSDGALYYKGWLLDTDLDKLPKEYVIKDGTERIAGGAFEHNESLKSITIPSSVKVICAEAFFNNPSLTEVVFNEGLEIIGTGNFTGAGITSVSFPESVTDIDPWAFQTCPYLHSVVLPEKLTMLRAFVFSFCRSLVNVDLYTNVYQVDPTALCPDYNDEACQRVTIYYHGTSSQWNAFSKCPEVEFNNVLTQGQRILTYEVPDFTPVYVPQKINEVTLNGKGTAYARFVITDKEGDFPARLKKIYYSVDGGPKKHAYTDNNGCVAVPVENITESGLYNIYITGPDIQGAIGTLKVDVEDLHFSSEFEGSIMAGARAGVSLGVGAEVSEIQAEASLGEIGAGIAAKMGLSASQEYANGKNKLTLTAKTNTDMALDGKIGLFAGAKAGEVAGIEVKTLEAGAEVVIGNLFGASMVIDDFDPRNITHVENVGKFILYAGTQMSPYNSVSKFVAEKIQLPVSSYESEVSITLGGSLAACVVDVKGTDGSDIGEVDIGSLSGSATTASKIVTNSDDSIEYENSYMQEAGSSVFDFKKKNVRNSKMEMGSSVYNSNFINNSLSLTAVKSEDGDLEKISYTEADTNDESIFWSKQKTVDKVTFEFDGEAASDMSDKSGVIRDFAEGEYPFFTLYEWDDVRNVVYEYGINGTFNSKKEYKQGFDVDISGKVKCLGDLGIKIGVSGIEGYEYEVENGLYEENTIFIQGENDIDDMVNDSFMGIEAIAYQGLTAIAEQVEQWFEYATVVLENIKNEAQKFGQAAIEKVGDTVEGWSLSVIKASEKIGPGKTLALSDEMALYSTSSLASTVGEPYIVIVNDADGNKVSDFSQNPLKLTLKYTDEELALAGVTDEPLFIMYWDENRNMYINVGGERDWENKNVSIEITKSGQYILAADNCPPSITGLMQSGNGKNPAIEAIISDFCGIENFELMIDDAVVVNNDNLGDYYDFTTGEFGFVTNGLENGEHYAKINVMDTAGNSVSQDICFEVNTITPKIGEISIVDYEYGYGKMFKAKIIDNDIPTTAYVNMEYVDLSGNTVKKSFEIFGWDDVYEDMIPNICAGAEVKYRVTAVNEYGNSATSEVFTYTHEPLKIMEEDYGGSVRYYLNNTTGLDDCSIVATIYDETMKLIEIWTVPVDESIYMSKSYSYNVMVLNGLKPMCENIKH